MPRTVDPIRHHARRIHIIDAALTCFATTGYDGTTTAEICRRAGIGSGTFFHYFPTKAAVLVAIIDLGAEQTGAWFTAQHGREDPLSVIDDYLEHTTSEMGDARLAGFVRAVGAVMSQAEVVAALERDEDALRLGLLPWITAAQENALVRTDLSPDRLTEWVMLLLNGFLDRLATTTGFTAENEATMLHDTAHRLLRPQ
ncbi:TetR/AcrR family transcriptional regulator [Kocuria marina]|uniref:TetR/AcrR family transcriptional regulator n=1 Tax=Kocuria marina TaxID=223184 RepID=UPI0022DEBC2E|nr:TetR/AcrR family transcriptional regulator [Kocuria marina]